MATLRLANAWLPGLLVAMLAFSLWDQLRLALQFGYGNWGMSEWLINYQGGFVRRGLPGEALFQLERLTGWPAERMVVLFSGLTFCALAGVASRWHRFVPVSLLSSAVLLGMPIYQGVLLRKESFCLLLLATCCFLLRRGWPSLARLLLVNALAVLAVLSHETFFFYGFPLLVLGLLLNGRRGWRGLIVALAALMPVILAFLACVLHRGDAALAQMVDASLRQVWERVGGAGCCSQGPSVAIEALAWSSERALGMSVSVWQEWAYGWLYVPLLWLLTAVACMAFCLSLMRPAATEAGGADVFALAFLFQALAVLPLFVLGWDYGRWLFIWVCSSFIAFDAFGARLSGLATLVDIAAPAARRLTLRQLHPLYLLLFAVPPCCWSFAAYATSTPIGGVGKAFYHAVNLLRNFQ